MSSYTPTTLKADNRLLVLCERDVGLFSLVQQVIANIPRALSENRVPVVLFGDRCCYFTPSGYRGRDTVWEYYFEPVVADAPASCIPEKARRAIQESWSGFPWTAFELDDSITVSNHFGDHPELEGRALRIPYERDDPGPALRRRTASIIQTCVRPREYLQREVDAFCNEMLSSSFVVGVHMRGTDAASGAEDRSFRWGSLNFEKYKANVSRLLDEHPDALIFVATDEERSLSFMQRTFGRRVRSYETLRHQDGNPVGRGPDGWLMPSYIASDRDRAARNGEEAVADYLTLCRCHHLIHNGSGLARTALLAMPNLPHTNTHHLTSFIGRSRHFLSVRMPWKGRRMLRYFATPQSERTP
jgi:hypothetical protein